MLPNQGVGPGHYTHLHAPVLDEGSKGSVQEKDNATCGSTTSREIFPYGVQQRGVDSSPRRVHYAVTSLHHIAWLIIYLSVVFFIKCSTDPTEMFYPICTTVWH